MPRLLYNSSPYYHSPTIARLKIRPLALNTRSISKPLLYKPPLTAPKSTPKRGYRRDRALKKRQQLYPTPIREPDTLPPIPIYIINNKEDKEEEEEEEGGGSRVRGG